MMPRRRHPSLSAGTLLALLLAAGAAPSFVSVAPAFAQTAEQKSPTPYAKWMKKMGGAETGLYGKWRAEVQEGGVRLTNVRNGSRVYYFTDGSQATQTPDGRVTLRAPDGASESRAADGSVKKSKPAKKKAKVRPVGEAWSAWMAFSTVQDGQVPVTEPPLPAADEPSVTIAPNGAQYVTLSDGSVMSIPPAGLMPPASPPAQTAGGGNPPPGPGDVNTTQGETPPATPTNLAVIGNLDGGFNLTWTDAATDEIAFEIERTPSFSEGQVTVAANLIQFSDAQDLPEVRYRVRANGVRLNSPWTAWVSAYSATDGFEVLVPGAGFAGETPQPAAIGTPDMPGFDAKAIARWDVVPYQTFTGNFHIGVVAFHMNGIDRVDFSANGGPWRSVREMQLNPRSNVWEYTAVLRASDFEDGPVEVRAKVYPSGAGEARVLESVSLYANAAGSLPAVAVYVSPTGDDIAGNGSAESPFRSIFRAGMAVQQLSGNGCADGGTIYLLPGDHDWGRAGYNANGQYIGNLTTVDRWLEVRAAPGVNRDQVRIVSASGGGLKTLRVKVHGVTFQGVAANNARAAETFPELWMEDCKLVGGDRTTNISWVSSGFANTSITDCIVNGGRYGFAGAKLVRNSKVTGTGDDAFANCQMIVNCQVDDLRIPAGSGYHGDVMQFHASATPQSNIIAYNLRATNCLAQPWHAGYTGHAKGPDWSDIAFVNVLIEAEGEPTAQWIPSTNHLLMWHVTLLGASVILRDNPVGGAGTGEPSTIHNMNLQSSIFQKFGVSNTGGVPQVADLTWASNNHFIDTTTYGAVVVGSSPTVGGQPSSLFVNALNDDYRPAALVLKNRFVDKVVPVDAAGRPVVSAIGALQP